MDLGWREQLWQTDLPALPTKGNKIMTGKARIAHLAGSNPTMQNTPPLVTSNKARTKHNLPSLTNPDGSPARFDVSGLRRLAAPVTVISSSSALPARS
jgi:hypothetical protein